MDERLCLKPNVDNHYCCYAIAIVFFLGEDIGVQLKSVIWPIFIGLNIFYSWHDKGWAEHSNCQYFIFQPQGLPSTVYCYPVWARTTWHIGRAALQREILGARRRSGGHLGISGAGYRSDTTQLLPSAVCFPCVQAQLQERWVMCRRLCMLTLKVLVTTIDALGHL